MKTDRCSCPPSTPKADSHSAPVSLARPVSFIRSCCLLLEGLTDDRPRTELRSDMYVMF
jgi:hypothetical protein